MRLTKRITALILFAGLSVAITACGNSAETESTASTATNAEPEQEQVELSFMTTWSDTDPYTGVYYKTAMKFMEENPNIKLDIETIPYGDYNVKLNTAAAAKQLPDLMLLISGGAQLTPLIQSNALLPIDDIMDNWPEEFLPSGKIQEFALDGKQYAIPGEISYSSMVYYNKRLLKEAGYEEFPTTYEDFKTLINDLNANNVVPIAIGNKTTMVLPAFLSQINDRISGNGLYADILAGTKKFTDPEFVQSLGVIKELYDMGGINTDVNTIDNVQAINLFLSEKTAMYIDGSWGVRQITNDMADDMELGFALLPAIEGGVGSMASLTSNANQGVGLNVNLDEKKKAAAEEFLKFMYNEAAYQSIISFGNFVPANVAQPDDVDPLFMEMSEIFTGITESSPPFNVTMPANISASLASGLQGLTTPGGLEPEALAATLQKEFEQ